MLVSIIIPVFNAEKHIDKCINSIFNQSYSDLQIIIIDDGSTDNSYFKCSSYRDLDSRVILVRQENRGVSSARNEGLSLVKGEYILFVDSDDYIEENMVEVMMNDIQKTESQIAMCGIAKRNNNLSQVNEKSKEEVIMYDTKSALRDLHYVDKYHGYVGNKLYSRKIIDCGNPLRFDENIYVCEDLLFCCEAITRANKIVYNSAQLYNYVFHNTNTSKVFNEKKLTAITAYDKIFQLLALIKVYDINAFIDNYNKLIISLMISNLESNHTSKQYLHNDLKIKLSRFRLNELYSPVTKISTLLAKTSPNLLVFFRKIRRLV